MSGVGFELAIPEFERSKTIRALDCENLFNATITQRRDVAGVHKR
jgi:hypothetical protein